MNLQPGRSWALIFSDRNWFEKVLVGVLIWLAAVGVAYIPVVGQILDTFILAFIAGYSVKVMREETGASADRLPVEMPVWTDFMQLFKDGILLTIGQTVYGVLLVVAFLLLMTATGGYAVLADAMAGETVVLPAAVLLAGIAFAVFAAFVGLIYIPVMSAHFAHEGRFLAMFDLATILRRSFSGIGKIIVIMFLTAVVAFLIFLAGITVIAFPFAVFIGQVFLSHLWAQHYRLTS